MNALALTVAICTYNRARDLEKTLGTLLQSSNALAINWELLVIDNNSSDDTPQIARRFAEQFPLRYVVEPVQGIAHARNRAIHEARSPFVLFTDDDVDVLPGWLETYVNLLQRYPDLAFASGIIEPAWQAPPPEWVKQYAATWLSGMTVWCHCGEEEHRFDIKHDYAYTANAGFKVEAIRAIGGFNTQLGRKRNERMGGEDVQAVETLARQGYMGLYAPQAMVRHRIYPERWSQRFIFRNFLGHGKMCARLQKNPPQKWFGAIPLGLSLVIGTALLHYVRGQIVQNPHLWLPGLCRLGWAIGEWKEYRILRKNQKYDEYHEE